MKQGREQIGDAFSKFGGNTVTAATGVTTLITDTGKAVMSPSVGVNPISSWIQMRTNSVSGINNSNI